MTTTVAATKRPVEPRRRPRHAAAVGVGLAVLAAVGSWAVATHGSQNPPRGLFSDSGAGFSADPRPVSLAQLMVALTIPGTADGQGHGLTFHAVRTSMGANTARASVSYWLCGGGGGDPTEFGSGDPARYCPTLMPISDGTRLDYPSPDQYVVAVITPTRPGRAHLVRADLTYTLDGAEVTDPVRLDATLRATPDLGS